MRVIRFLDSSLHSPLPTRRATGRFSLDMTVPPKTHGTVSGTRSPPWLPGYFSRMAMAFRLVTTLISSVCLCHSAPPTGAGWDLTWNDEFLGSSLDTGKWRYWLPGKRRDAINSPSSVAVADGNLAISTYTLDGTHYTGMISSQNTYQYTYGYIEARIRFDTTPGMWSAFWMQSDTMGNPVGSPNTAGTEIDICEHRVVDGNGTNLSGKIVGNLHWDGYGANHRSTGYTSPDLGLGTDYHIYGMEWTPSQQKFYIDGVLRWTVENGANSPVSQRSEFIILSSEVDQTSTTWAGAIPSAGYGSLDATATRMLVDYVRVYRRAETAINGGFDGKIAPFSPENQTSWSSTGGVDDSPAAKLAPTSSAGATVRQTLRGLLPDTGYTVSAWGNPGGTAPSLSIGANSFGGNQVAQTLTTPAYSLASTAFTTGTTNRSASVFAKSNLSGSLAHVDDFLLRRHASVNHGQVENDVANSSFTSYGGATVTADSSYEGNHAWKFPAYASSGVEQEILGLTPNTTYQFTGWTTNANTGLTFGVKNHGGNQVSSQISSNAWKKATVPFTTGGTSTSATVFAFRTGGSQPAYADTFFLCQPLASPWSGQDVSGGGLAGMSGCLANRFTLLAQGTNISGVSDQFHLVSQPVSGDATITARVVGVAPTAFYAKAGLMIRESSAVGSRHASVTWGPVNQMVDFSSRVATNGTTTSTQTNREITTAPWLRLSRRGNVFTCWQSPDGVAWKRLGTPQTIPMANHALIGIAACSGDDSRLSETCLDQVSVKASALPDVTITSPTDAITISLNGQSLQLNATINSSTTTSVAWSKVSGPGTATFANPSSASTSATFSLAGTYLLRCTAVTADGSGCADVTVNVSPPQSPDPSLAFRLKLDESSGTLASDSSGNALHASANGTVTWQPAGGAITGAVAFHGDGSYLQVPDSPWLDNSGSLSISFWFFANTLGNNTGLVSKRISANDNNAYSTFLGLDGKLTVDIQSTNNRFTSNTTFIPGAWYHVAIIFNGSLAESERVKLYVNGILDRSAAESSTSIPNSTAPLRAGVLAPGGNGFNGRIDEIRIHRRALSAAEVSAAYQETGNLGPNVSTGLAPAVVVNSPGTLNGNASSEAGPPPAVTWSKVSGPGNVVFSSPNSPTSGVSFDQPGEYVLRLTANNTYGVTFADLADTVFPLVLPPPDLTIAFPAEPVSLPDSNHQLRLAAVADTHQVPGSPTFTWSQLAGPAQAIIQDSTAADTSASFPLAGTYLLRCTATNTAGTSHAETSVTVGSNTATATLCESPLYQHQATFIRNDITSWNSGARDQLLIGRLSGGYPMRSLLSFPVDLIPANATISQCSLDLRTHDTDAGTGSMQAIELHPLSESFTEGNGTSSDKTAINGNGSGATWTHRTPTSTWNTAGGGGDFLTAILSTLPAFDPTLKSTLRSFPSTPAFVATAQSAVNHSGAIHLILVSPSTEAGSGIHFARFAADDHPNPSLRPQLSLLWSTRAAPVILPATTPSTISGNPANIAASVTGATSSQWSLVSGPGSASFLSTFSPATTVTFSSPGNYLLRLTATNAWAETSRTLQMTVAPNPAVFSDWQSMFWPDGAPSTQTNMTADPDADGLNNLLEWALHLDPLLPDSFQPMLDTNFTSIRFRYLRRTILPGSAQFEVQWSDSLSDDWTSADVVTEKPIRVDDHRESVLATIPASPSGRRFVRVMLTCQ